MEILLTDEDLAKIEKDSTDNEINKLGWEFFIVAPRFKHFIKILECLSYEGNIVFPEDIVINANKVHEEYSKYLTDNLSHLPLNKDATEELDRVKLIFSKLLMIVAKRIVQKSGYYLYHYRYFSPITPFTSVAQDIIKINLHMFWEWIGYYIAPTSPFVSYVKYQIAVQTKGNTLDQIVR